MKDFGSFGTDHQSVYLCHTDFKNTRSMEYMLHNFNLLTFVKQLILHIKICLSCDVKCIICGG